MWRVKDEPLNNVMSLLYEDEEEALSLGEEVVIEEFEEEESCDEDEETPGAATRSPVGQILSQLESAPSSPDERRRPPSPVEGRSRSPIWERSTDPQTSNVVIRIYAEDGCQLEDLHVRDICEDFLEADAHLLYPKVELMETDGNNRLDNTNERIDVVVDELGGGDREVRARARGRRGSGRGQASGRVRGGGRRRGRGRGPRATGGRGTASGGANGPNRTRWAVGDPLTEIWLEDDDVPSELRSLVMNMIISRETRSHEREAREREARERGRTNDIDSEGEDMEFHDALLAPQDRVFKWSPMESFQSTEEQFLPDRTGSTEQHQTPYAAFRSYWDDKILQYIVENTNLYASRISSAGFEADWFPTNAHEILVLFSFWMMLGIIRMPTIKSCFSSDPLLKTEIFRRMFTLRRYNSLCRALHFIDNENPAVASDRLKLIRPIITHLNTKFQANYTLSKDICIDESLTLWKGRLNFKQYIRSKVAKFGIKTFELCESATGYLWSFIVYTGKDTSLDAAPDSTLLKSTPIVVQLIGPLLNKGYRLFMDNWFNSPFLARYLKRNGTDCVGTLRPSRRDVPPLINLAKLKRGQIVARQSGDICVMAWQDKKKVTTISTCHGTATGLSTVSSSTTYRPIPYKPQVVLDYNRNMGGVDLKDQMLEPYLLERKRGNKWYMKLFKRLLNCSILNSRILLQSSLQQRQDHLAFRLRLVDNILHHHLPHCPLSRSHSSNSKSTLPFRTHLHSHWPVHNEQKESDSQRNRKTRQKCFVCLQAGRKTQKTQYKCDTCDVSLCIDGCFKAYHVNL